MDLTGNTITWYLRNLQRWDYVLSRWAYSTSVFSWELANENDDWAGWGPAGVQVQVRG